MLVALYVVLLTFIGAAIAFSLPFAGIPNDWASCGSSTTVTSTYPPVPSANPTDAAEKIEQTEVKEVVCEPKVMPAWLLIAGFGLLAFLIAPELLSINGKVEVKIPFPGGDGTLTISSAHDPTAEAIAAESAKERRERFREKEKK